MRMSLWREREMFLCFNVYGASAEIFICKGLMNILNAIKM